MTTLTSGSTATRTAPRATPTDPSLFESLLSPIAGFYAAYKDAQSLAFRRASKSATRMHWSQDE
jgi:hypothetical protein